MRCDEAGPSFGVDELQPARVLDLQWPDHQRIIERAGRSTAKMGPVADRQSTAFGLRNQSRNIKADD